MRALPSYYGIGQGGRWHWTTFCPSHVAYPVPAGPAQLPRNPHPYRDMISLLCIRVPSETLLRTNECRLVGLQGG